MPKFNFDSEIQESKWAVEPIIPLGQLVFLLAQAGVGKSLVAEDLAVHIVHEIPFCGFVTNYGDVLIIDQDTPTAVLSKRLIRFAKGLNSEPKHELFVETMRNFSLSDGTIMTAIKSHPSVVMVIIDSLHSVCGKFNPNSTGDMSSLARLKSTCLKEDRTILINHHISEKLNYSVEQLMTENSHTMSMGNSAIIQQADSYYIVGATAENGITNKIYLRPVAKRVSIRSTPLILQLLQTSEEGERMEFGGDYVLNLSDEEQDCLTLFKENPSDRTVKEVYEDIGHRHGEIAIRTALKTLTDKALLVMSRHRSNLFKYRLP
jgi:hypothetical protein